MWRGLLATTWQCLVVIPCGPRTPTAELMDALHAQLSHVGDKDTGVVDARGASIEQGSRLVEEAVGTKRAGSRAIAFIDPITLSLAGVPLVRVADAVLLVVQVDSSDEESFTSTLSIVGPDRVVGSVAVPAAD